MKLKNYTLLIPVVFAGLAPSVRAATTLGLNFTREYNNTRIQGGTADGFSGWTDSWDLTGDQDFRSRSTAIVLDGSTTVGVTWNSSNIFFAGQEDNKEQALYRSYLDDGNIDGLGVRVTITGLSSWLVAEGMTSYQIRAYASTDTDGATFHTISIRDGATTSGSVLGTISPAVLGDNDYPTGAFDQNWDPRGYGDSADTLTADTITLTIPVKDGNIRGSLAGFKLTAVPEPSAALFCGLGLLSFLVRRRK